MTVSYSAMKEMLAEESGRYPVMLLTVSGAGLEQPLHFCDQPFQRLESLTTDENVVYGCVSNATEYLYVPMNIELPEDREGVPQSMQLTIGNAGREMVEAVRTLSHSPIISISLVMSDNVHSIQFTRTGFKLASVEIDNLQITGQLYLDTSEHEGVPYLSCTPATTPGLF